MTSEPIIIYNPLLNGLDFLESDSITSNDLKQTQQNVTVSYPPEYKIIQHHIRNMQVLNEIQMLYIKSLPHELKDEILEVYNQCIQLFNDVMKD